MTVLLASQAAHALGVALLLFVVQGAIIAGLTAVALYASRRDKANTRYAIACGGLLAMFMAPMATAVNEWRRASEWPVLAVNVAAQPAGPLEGSAMAVTPLPTIPSAFLGLGTALQTAAEPWLPSLVVIWSLGVAFMAVRLIGSCYAVGRLRRRCLPIDSAWTSRVRFIASQLGIARVIAVVRSSHVEVPTVIGWLRPTLLLPIAAVSGLTAEQVDAILAHELAHIRRHDYVINLVQHVAEALLFYHPAVWWLSNRIRMERELCCDDVAAALCGDRAGYADALASLEERRSAADGLAVAATSGGSLIVRVRRLIEPPAQDRRGVGSSLAVGAVLIALIFPLAGQASGQADSISDAGGNVAAAVVGFAAPAAAPASQAGDQAVAGLRMEYKRTLDRYAALVAAKAATRARVGATGAPPQADAVSAQLQIVRQQLAALEHQLEAASAGVSPFQPFASDSGALTTGASDLLLFLQREYDAASQDYAASLARTQQRVFDAATLGVTATDPTAEAELKQLRERLVGVERRLEQARRLAVRSPGAITPTGRPLTTTARPLVQPAPLQVPDDSRARVVIPAPQTGIGGRQTDRLVEAEIRRLEERYASAKLANDVGTLRQLLDDAFVGTNQNGNTRDKVGSLELWASFRISSLTLGPAAITISGDTATVNGGQTEVTTTGLDRMLFTRVWRRSANGTWLLLASAQFRDPNGDNRISIQSGTREATLEQMLIARALMARQLNPDRSAMLAIEKRLAELNADSATVAAIERRIFARIESAVTSQPPPPPPPGVTLRVGGDVREPIKIRDVRPVYPEAARASRVTGLVIIDAVVDELGNVQNPRILRSVPMFDQAALDAVVQWKYAPPMLNGQPVAVQMTVTVNFVGP